MKRYKTNAELFADGRRSLVGNMRVASWSFLIFVVVTIFLTQLSSSVSFPNMSLTLAFSLVAGFTTSLFGSVLGTGLALVFLNLQYDQPASVGNLLVAFSGNTDRIVRVRFFVTMGEYLCLLPINLLLFFAPWNTFPQFIPLVPVICAVAIIAFGCWSLTYAMADFLLLDFPDQDPERILAASQRLMRGNRIRYFFLLFRLMPMHLLGILSFGLANIWAGCCQYACSAAFYKDLMAQVQE